MLLFKKIRSANCKAVYFNRFFLLLLVLLVTLCTGCLSKKINKWVANRYGEPANAQPKVKSDYLLVTSPLIATTGNASETKHEVKNFLPLAVYWQFDYRNTCTINPSIPVNNFAANLQSYANAKGLKQKLNGQQVTLTIDRIPNVFVMNDREHTIFLLLYAASWYNVTIAPGTDPLAVSYKITKDKVETTTGVITINNLTQKLRLRFMEAPKKATREYLDAYDEAIKDMSRQVIDKLAAEMDKATAMVPVN